MKRKMFWLFGLLLVFLTLNACEFFSFTTLSATDIPPTTSLNSQNTTISQTTTSQSDTSANIPLTTGFVIITDPAGTTSVTTSQTDTSMPSTTSTSTIDTTINETTSATTTTLPSVTTSVSTITPTTTAISATTTTTTTLTTTTIIIIIQTTTTTTSTTTVPTTSSTTALTTAPTSTTAEPTTTNIDVDTDTIKSDRITEIIPIVILPGGIYRFALQVDEESYIIMDADSNIDTYIEIFDSLGNIVDFDDNGNLDLEDFLLECVLSTGTYTVEISSPNPSAEASFLLYFSSYFMHTEVAVSGYLKYDPIFFEGSYVEIPLLIEIPTFVSISFNCSRDCLTLIYIDDEHEWSTGWYIVRETDGFVKAIAVNLSPGLYNIWIEDLISDEGPPFVYLLVELDIVN